MLHSMIVPPATIIRGRIARSQPMADVQVFDLVQRDRWALVKPALVGLQKVTQNSWAPRRPVRGLLGSDVEPTGPEDGCLGSGVPSSS